MILRHVHWHAASHGLRKERESGCVKMHYAGTLTLKSASQIFVPAMRWFNAARGEYASSPYGKADAISFAHPWIANTLSKRWAVRTATCRNLTGRHCAMVPADRNAIIARIVTFYSVQIPYGDRRGELALNERTWVHCSVCKAQYQERVWRSLIEVVRQERLARYELGR